MRTDAISARCREDDHFACPGYFYGWNGKTDCGCACGHDRDARAAVLAVSRYMGVSEFAVPDQMIVRATGEPWSLHAALGIAYRAGRTCENARPGESE